MLLARTWFGPYVQTRHWVSYTSTSYRYDATVSRFYCRVGGRLGTCRSRRFRLALRDSESRGRANFPFRSQTRQLHATREAHRNTEGTLGPNLLVEETIWPPLPLLFFLLRPLSLPGIFACSILGAITRPGQGDRAGALRSPQRRRGSGLCRRSCVFLTVVSSLEPIALSCLPIAVAHNNQYHSSQRGKMCLT